MPALCVVLRRAVLKCLYFSFFLVLLTCFPSAASDYEEIPLALRPLAFFVFLPWRVEGWKPGPVVSRRMTWEDETAKDLGS